MTKEEWAAALNGREYTKEITRQEEREAKEDKMLIVFGASDDLIELRGVTSDEVGGPGKVQIGRNGGVVQELEEAEELIRQGWTPPTVILEITATWCPDDPKTSWLITSSSEAAPFDIMEDGELYCRGVVIDCSTWLAGA